MDFAKNSSNLSEGYVVMSPSLQKNLYQNLTVISSVGVVLIGTCGKEITISSL